MWFNKPDYIPQALIELETCVNIATQLPKIVDGSSIFDRIKHKVRCLSEDPITGTEQQQLAALERLTVARSKLAVCRELPDIDLLQLIQKRIAVIDSDHPIHGTDCGDSSTATEGSEVKESVAAHIDHSLSSRYCVPLLSADIKPIDGESIYLVDPLFLLFDEVKKHYVIFQDTESRNRDRKPVTFAADAIGWCVSDDGERLHMGLAGGVIALYLCFEEEVDKSSSLKRLENETDLTLALASRTCQG